MVCQEVKLYENDDAQLAVCTYQEVFKLCDEVNSINRGLSALPKQLVIICSTQATIFLPSDAIMHSADYAVARYHSVRLSRTTGIVSVSDDREQTIKCYWVYKEVLMRATPAIEARQRHVLCALIPLSLPSDAMHSADSAVARCLYVCLPQSGIVTKRHNLRSKHFTPPDSPAESP